jgi:choline dehydrogenase-like flavoprotein
MTSLDTTTDGLDSALASNTVLERRVDVVVVGLGAGGGMVFHDLARAGADVLGVEMGSALPTESISQIESEMLPRLFQESGARSTEDFGVNILQGKGVGGSTVHNTNLCKRLPEPILEQWEQEYGLDWATSVSLQSDFEAVEQLLGVQRIPDDRVNPNNRLIARGIEALGWEGGRLKHNRDHDDCRESGFCELGCPNSGKQNAAKVLIPPGLEAGGRVLTEARIDEILVEEGRAVGVRGVAADPVSKETGRRLEIRADVVCLSASATGTAALLQQSDVPDPYGLAGTNLHVHPGATVLGRFDPEEHGAIRSWLGNPQSVECTEYLEVGPSASRRAWLLAGAAHPAGAANFVPGFGPSHGELMAEYPQLANIIVMLHDHASGRVRPGEGEQLHVHYRLDDAEYDQLAMGMRAAGRILLAAGADEVIVPTATPFRASTERELDDLRGSDLGPLDPPLAAVHPMSTAWMGAEPTESVVDPRGEHHQVDDLFVADGSLFPTSIGGPPQLPIYTFGRRVGRSIAESV